MAMYEKDGTLSVNDQMDIRSKEQEILASNQSPQLKASLIKQLYGSYGLTPGNFRRPEFAESGSGENYSSSSEVDDSDWSAIKWLIIVGFILFLVLKADVWFVAHYPVAGHAVNSVITACIGFVVYSIGKVMGWIFN
jgi:hypothetical protein